MLAEKWKRKNRDSLTPGSPGWGRGPQASCHLFRLAQLYGLKLHWDWLSEVSILICEMGMFSYLFISHGSWCVCMGRQTRRSQETSLYGNHKTVYKAVTEVYKVSNALLRTALLPSESKSDNPLYPASVQISYLLDALMAMIFICYVETLLDPSQWNPSVRGGAQWFYNPTPKFLEEIKWMMARVPNSWARFQPIPWQGFHFTNGMCPSGCPPLPKNMQSLNCHSNPIILPLHKV